MTVSCSPWEELSLGPPVSAEFILSDEGITRVSLSLTKGGIAWRAHLLSDKASTHLDAIRQWVVAYAAKKAPKKALPFASVAFPPFTRKVLTALSEIPLGESVSYQEVASRVGVPKATRAVGTACGRNPFPLVVPCHRVVRTGGGLGGFAFDLEIKKQLLIFEGVPQ